MESKTQAGLATIAGASFVHLPMGRLPKHCCSDVIWLSVFRVQGAYFEYNHHDRSTGKKARTVSLKYRDRSHSSYLNALACAGGAF